MHRIIAAALLLSSFFCYMEWGSKSSFLLEVEYSIFKNVNVTSEPLAHPIIFIPLIGQLLLLVSIVRKRPGSSMIFLGAGMISILIMMILLSGLVGMNWKVTVSTLPFVAISIFG